MCSLRLENNLLTVRHVRFARKRVFYRTCSLRLENNCCSIECVHFVSKIICLILKVFVSHRYIKNIIIETFVSISLPLLTSCMFILLGWKGIHPACPCFLRRKGMHHVNIAGGGKDTPCTSIILLVVKRIHTTCPLSNKLQQF
jgi:hypothetical protein